MLNALLIALGFRNPLNGLLKKEQFPGYQKAIAAKRSTLNEAYEQLQKVEQEVREETALQQLSSVRVEEASLLAHHLRMTITSLENELLRDNEETTTIAARN